MKFSIKLIYLLNLWPDSHQSSTAIPLGQSKELTMFLVTSTPFSRSKSFYIEYLLNQWMDLIQTGMDV